MAVTKKKEKPSAEELVKKEFRDATTALKDWATYELPMGDGACRAIEKFASQLSALYDKDEKGGLFTKHTVKESIKYGDALLDKLNALVKSKKEFGKDASAAKAAASALESYLAKLKKPEETAPETTFSTAEHDETIELKVSWTDPKTEKCITSTVEIPKEKIESWTDMYAETIAEKGVAKKYESPVFGEILDFFGVKKEFQLYSNSMLVLVVSSKSKAEEYITTELEELATKIREYSGPDTKFHVFVGPPEAKKSWKLQAAEKVMNDVMAAGEAKAFVIKAEKEEKEKKKAAEIVGKKLAKKFPVK